MKCPSCSSKPISFINWAKGSQWYKTKCVECNAKLKANRNTWIAFIIAIFLGIAVGIYSIDVLFFNKYTGLLFGAITIFIFSFISYSSFCGYLIDE